MTSQKIRSNRRVLSGRETPTQCSRKIKSEGRLNVFCSGLGWPWYPQLLPAHANARQRAHAWVCAALAHNCNCLQALWLIFKFWMLDLSARHQHYWPGQCRNFRCDRSHKKLLHSRLHTTHNFLKSTADCRQCASARRNIHNQQFSTSRI